MNDAVMAEAGSQQLRALQQANRVRLARAELKRRIAAGEVSVTDVVLDCPYEAEGMALSDLLMSQRRWGAARCRRLLLSVGLPERKAVGTLTERQRHLLAGALTPGRGEAVEPLALVPLAIPA